jgi:mono/diheme cytochrome c family protein
MSKSFLILATLAFCGFPALLEGSQQPATAPPAAGAQVPADAASKVNPVHSTPASLSRAKDIYTFDCALCHGADGSGKNDVADMKVKDYRDPSALKGLTDGEVYYIIDQGKGSMPSEHGRAKPDEIWNLVIYLRTFSKGQMATASQAPADQPAAQPAAQAPAAQPPN